MRYWLFISGAIILNASHGVVASEWVDSFDVDFFMLACSAEEDSKK